ncbi:Adenine phosphoribosyltransferase [Tetrabaena socialis]|uniref:adenine phosphoribosyltransferase n=1 Tax=Tetrabaena socialis TaxID=47790 RepID=A0A2J8AF85_9CHLO|nr:Adenine phosphoribosyltransferase [Tetrabaena socialis]|eukprot:PNH11193.1 Adenine phosphoribosyltransferase [Tetrabaena socialis]
MAPEDAAVAAVAAAEERQALRQRACDRLGEASWVLRSNKPATGAIANKPQQPPTDCLPGLPRWVVTVSGRRGAGKDFLAAAAVAEAAAGCGLRAAALRQRACDRLGEASWVLRSNKPATGAIANKPQQPPTDCLPGLPRWVVTVSGRRGAGKDFLAAAAVAEAAAGCGLRAAGPGAEAEARAYKEAHRQGLLEFHQQQVAEHGPDVLLRTFLGTVRSAAGCGAQLLLVTGMRELELLSLPQRCHQLLPGTQVLTVLVLASERTKARRHGWRPNTQLDCHPSEAALEAAPRGQWGAVFENEREGEEAARAWARRVLLPLLQGARQQASTREEAAWAERWPSARDQGYLASAPDVAARGMPSYHTLLPVHLQTKLSLLCPNPTLTSRQAPRASSLPGGEGGTGLAARSGQHSAAAAGDDEEAMLERLRLLVPCVRDFPRPGIVFRNVLHLESEGLALCTELLAKRLLAAAAAAGGGIDAVAGIEAGGLVFAAPLAAHLRVPLVPLRKHRLQHTPGSGNGQPQERSTANDDPSDAAAALVTPPPVLVSPVYGGSFIGREGAAAAMVAAAAAGGGVAAACHGSSGDPVERGRQQAQQQAQPRQQCEEEQPPPLPRPLLQGDQQQQQPQKQQHHHQQPRRQQQQQQRLEVWAGALRAGQRVALVDDLLASGATAAAAVQLLRAAGAVVAAVGVAAELPAHGGRGALRELRVGVEALLEYEGL